MTKDELVHIHTLDDLKKLAGKMKAAFARDQTKYIAETPEAEDVLDKMSDEDIEEMMECDSNQAILWNQNIFSIVCTENKQNDHRWHLSTCKIVGPGKLGPIDDSEMEFIMSGFFEAWQEIKSPSKMPAVRHFTGD
jgi:hypothetical protein